MRPLWIALIIWNLALVLETCDCRPMGERWSRVRKVPLSSSQRARQTGVETPPGSGSNIVFRPGLTSRPACKKTVIFNKPGSSRKPDRNRGVFEGRRLRKVKIVKKYSRQKPSLSTPSDPRQEFVLLKHSRSGDAFRLLDVASRNEVLFFKPAEHSRPEVRQIVLLSGAHSPTLDYGSGWGRAMNDVTIVHNRRQYTLSTSSKAKLRGFPGLVMHVKKM